MIKIAMPNIHRELDWSKLRRDEMKKSSDHFTPPSPQNEPARHQEKV